MLVKGPRTNIKAIPTEPTHAAIKNEGKQKIVTRIFFQNNLKLVVGIKMSLD